MPNQIAARSTPTARCAPQRRELSRALSIAASGDSSPESAHQPAVLDRLDAISRTLQMAPTLDQAMRLPTVLATVGLSKSSWYSRLNQRSPAYDPRAPQPFKLGTSRNSPSVWWRSAVMAYLNACANAQAQA